MQRLYKAVEELRKITQKAAVARLLNVSQQTLDTWGKRGLSRRGALLAQEKIGCDANWLRDSVEPLTATAATLPNLHDVRTSQVSDINATSFKDDFWPFRLVSQKRLIELRRALGPKLGAMAIQDIDNQVEIVVMKWERSIANPARPSAG
jgi:hypothetical protein